MGRFRSQSRKANLTPIVSGSIVAMRDAVGNGSERGVGLGVVDPGSAAKTGRGSCQSGTMAGRDVEVTGKTGPRRAPVAQFTWRVV